MFVVRFVPVILLLGLASAVVYSPLQRAAIVERYTLFRDDCYPNPEGGCRCIVPDEPEPKEFARDGECIDHNKEIKKTRENYAKLMAEFKEKYGGYRENCFPRPRQGCFCAEFNDKGKSVVNLYDSREQCIALPKETVEVRARRDTNEDLRELFGGQLVSDMSSAEMRDTFDNIGGMIQANRGKRSAVSDKIQELAKQLKENVQNLQNSTFVAKVEELAQKLKENAHKVAEKSKVVGKDVAEKIKETGKKIQESAERLGEKGKVVGKEVFGKVKDNAQKVGEKAKVVGKDVAEKIKETAKKVKESAERLGERAEQLGERGLALTKEYLQKVKESAQDFRENSTFVAKAEELLQQAKENAHKLAEKVKEQTLKIKESAEQFAEKSLVVGKEAMQKAKENAQKLAEQAKEQAQKLGEKGMAMGKENAEKLREFFEKKFGNKEITATDEVDAVVSQAPIEDPDTVREFAKERHEMEKAREQAELEKQQDETREKMKPVLEELKNTVPVQE